MSEDFGRSFNRGSVSVNGLNEGNVDKGSKESRKKEKCGLLALNCFGLAWIKEQ